MEKNIHDNDEFNFAEEVESREQIDISPWKILIVDDEAAIHNITKMVLKNLTYLDTPLEFESAYSGQEAKRLIKDNPDTALILLDVVMENENSGLDVVKFIREELNNRAVRIVLRTGYPGRIPEKKVIIDYDINDYKEKTDLSSQKLLTSVISSLRSFNYIKTIAELNRSLENKVAERTKQLEAANIKLYNSIENMKEDLEAGKKTQFRLLPDNVKVFGQYKFSMQIFPSHYLSGDFLDYFDIDDNYFGFYFADVCGHGASSAFVTILLKTTIDNILNNYKEGKNNIILNPSLLAIELNKSLLREKLDKHLTLFYGVVNKNTNKINCVNCGHFPYPILFDTNEFRSLKIDGGAPIGLFEFAEYKSREIDFPEKFAFLLVSDGIIELLPQQLIDDKQSFLESQINDMSLTIDDIIKRVGIEDITKNIDDITFLLIKKSNKIG